jgi:glutathione S-transferase
MPNPAQALALIQMGPSYTLWGSELSPFYLKVEACLRASGIAIDHQPQNGGYLRSLAYQVRVKALTSGIKKITWPNMTALDELPLVPFMFDKDNRGFYDSTAFAHWLDQHHGSQLTQHNDPAINMVSALIDEYADEFGLYMVHHMRWKFSAGNNNAGQRLAEEFKGLMGPLSKILTISFPKRQVRRLPYLFSVAPEGYQQDGLHQSLQPPHRIGFPETHSLLETALAKLLKALETILSRRPYLFGNKFTLADASLYGQLGMNLTDSAAAMYMENTAPNTFNWLSKIRKGEFSEHAESKPDASLALHNDLKPLLTEIQRSFIPLMQQNESAYESCLKKGETVFNEKAFNQGRALYRGSIDGKPFKTAVKSFQVAAWRKLKRQWNALESSDKTQLQALSVRFEP